MKISPFSNDSLNEIADQLGWAGEQDATDNLIPVVIVLCKRVDMLENQIKELLKTSTNENR